MTHALTHPPGPVRRRPSPVSGGRGPGAEAVGRPVTRAGAPVADALLDTVGIDGLQVTIQPSVGHSSGLHPVAVGIGRVERPEEEATSASKECKHVANVLHPSYLSMPINLHRFALMPRNGQPSALFNPTPTVMIIYSVREQPSLTGTLA